MEFPNDFQNRIESYLNNDKFNIVAEKLEIFNEKSTKEEKISRIEKYILEVLNGSFGEKYLERAIKKFFDNVDLYLQKMFVQKDRFPRYEEGRLEGFIKTEELLPKTGENGNNGLRRLRSKIGYDGEIYIIKQAEGVRGAVSGMENSKDALYNATIAQSIFTFFNEDCAEYIPGCSGFPYYEIFSKNFLKENEELQSIKDIASCDIKQEEGNKISHSEIIKGLKRAIVNRCKSDLSKEKISEICSKVELQYAVQETIKKLIVSADENLGNTSIIFTKSKDKIIDANISPAYDLDISFQLGEELLKADPLKHSFFYRTSKEGSTELEDLITDFSEEVDGYKEKLQSILNMLNGNYIEQIFENAYKNSKVEGFKDKKLQQKYTTFIIRRIAILKETSKRMFLQEDKKQIK